MADVSIAIEKLIQRKSAEPKERQDLDVRKLREDILEGDPYKGGFREGSTLEELQRLEKDSLTGLRVRAVWEAEMERYLEFAGKMGIPVAVAMMDVDNFKEFNDSKGHAAGDQLLRDFGGAVQERFRQTDISGRFGGDELIVMLTDFKIGEEDLKDQEKSFSEDLGKNIGRGVSAGIVMWNGKETLGELIKRADDRLFIVKAERKSQQNA